MAKRKIIIAHTCDECGAQENTVMEDARYVPDDEIPEGWGFVTVSLNVEDVCKCKCHDDEHEEDEDGDMVNVAGHEDYDCEVCPEDNDERWAATLCTRCIRKTMAMLKLPKGNDQL